MTTIGKNQVQVSCKCGANPTVVRKGSQCDVRGMCSRCLADETVGVGGGQEAFVPTEPITRPITGAEKIPRNATCICGSGIKAKRCCLLKLQARDAESRRTVA